MKERRWLCLLRTSVMQWKDRSDRGKVVPNGEEDEWVAAEVRRRRQRSASILCTCEPWRALRSANASWDVGPAHAASIQGTPRANHAKVPMGHLVHSGSGMPASPGDFPRNSRDWLGMDPRDCFLLRHPQVANVLGGTRGAGGTGGSKVLVPGG